MSVVATVPAPAITKMLVCNDPDCKKHNLFHVSLSDGKVIIECNRCGRMFVVLGCNMLLQERKLLPDGTHGVISQINMS